MCRELIVHSELRALSIMCNDLRHRERRDRYAGKRRAGSGQYPQPVREYDRICRYPGFAVASVEDVCSGSGTRNDHRSGSGITDEVYEHGHHISSNCGVWLAYWYTCMDDDDWR